MSQLKKVAAGVTGKDSGCGVNIQHVIAVLLPTQTEGVV